MIKEKIRILIPLICIGIVMIYGWTTILFTPILATWRHYSGLVLFVGIVFLFFKSLNTTVFAIGIFLLIATFNGLAITATITTSQFGVGSVMVTPPMQLLSLGLFVLYFLLNLDALIELYLDFKDRKKASR